MSTTATPVTSDLSRQPTRSPAPSRTRLVAVYLLVCAIWGTTWLGMKVGVASIPPMTAAGLRFMIAFPFLLALIKVTPAASLVPPAGKRWLVWFVAVFYIAIPYALINYGEQYVSSGLASLMFASVTGFLLLFSWLVSRVRTTPRQVAGTAVGMVLLAVLMANTSGLNAAGLVPPLAILLAAAMHAFAYAILGEHGGDVHVLTIEALPIGIGGALVLSLGLLVERPDAASFTVQSWLGILYLALVASVVGFAAYFYLLKHLSTLTVSYVFIFFPVVATFVSAVVEGAHLGWVPLLLAAGMLGAFALTKAASPPAAEESR
jgi:putative membrane protein PagO